MYFVLTEPFPVLPSNKTNKVTVVVNENSEKPRNWGWFVLFASTSTLICCALPILLVSLGMGAVVAAMASNIPFLITLSQHKSWVFAASFMLLLLASWLLYRPGRSCPTDPVLAEQCASAHKWNQRFFWSSLLIWLIGFFTAYILVLMTE